MVQQALRPAGKLRLLCPAAGKKQEVFTTAVRQGSGELRTCGKSPLGHIGKLLIDLPAAKVDTDIDVPWRHVFDDCDINRGGPDVDDQDVAVVFGMTGAAISDVYQGGLRLGQQI